MKTFLSIQKRRPGATFAGIFSVALSSVLLLCGAGLTPTGNVQRADINANGFSLTNAATVSATNGYFNNLAVTNAAGARVNLGVPYNQVIAESASVTAATNQAGALFNFTTGSSALTATLPAAASAGNGATFYFRKADSGSGSVAVNGTLLGVQGHMLEVVTDGTSWLNRPFFGGFDSSGDITVTATPNANINLVTSGTGKAEVNGTVIGGTGTVTSVGTSSLSALFTATIINPTTTPLLNFSPTAVSQNYFYAGQTSGGSGTPYFRAIVPADIPTLNQNTTGSAGSVALSGVTGSGSGFLTAAADAVNGPGGLLAFGSGSLDGWGWPQTGTIPAGSVVVILGDSIQHGFNGVSDGTPPGQYLSGLAAFAGIPVYVFAVDGTTAGPSTSTTNSGLAIMASGATGSFAYSKFVNGSLSTTGSASIASLVPSSPAKMYFIAAFGANDLISINGMSFSSFKTDMTSIWTTAHGLGSNVVVIDHTITDRMQVSKTTIALWNSWLRGQVAALQGSGAAYPDLMADFNQQFTNLTIGNGIGDSTWSADGLHPTVIGQKMLGYLEGDAILRNITYPGPLGYEPRVNIYADPGMSGTTLEGNPGAIYMMGGTGSGAYAGSIQTYGGTGTGATGGNIFTNANGNYAGGQLNTQSGGSAPGGGLNLSSATGATGTPGSLIAYTTSTGNGGTLNLISSGAGNGGSIQCSASSTGNAGSISTYAGFGANGGSISTYSATTSAAGGSINTASEAGTGTPGNIYTYTSSTGNGGNIYSYSTGAGNAGYVQTYAAGAGNGGHVATFAGGSGSAGVLETYSTGTGNGGNLNLYTQGAGNGGSIDAAGGNSSGGNGGSIYIYGNGSTPGGTLTLASGTNTITTSGSTQYTITIPAARNDTFALLGTAQTFTATQTVTSGNIVDDTAGDGLQVKEGSNAKQGTATLSSGAVTVSNTSVTANSRIFLTAEDNNSTGALRVSARTAGTSFTITSSNGSDSGVVAYEIFEPAP